MASNSRPHSPGHRTNTVNGTANERGDYRTVPQTPDVVEARKYAPIEASSSSMLPIVSYCLSSILMTVINKFVVSGKSFNMTCVVLFLQSLVCVLCVTVCKRLGIISFQEFDPNIAKRWFPISSFLLAVIYTGSKSLQYLSIPVYTIFKNLTIILIAYGEVIWFNGRITSLMLVSFGLMVLSSIMASWSDWVGMFTATYGAADSIIVADAKSHPTFFGLNIGYLWMLSNCFASAAYPLTMKSRIKQFKLKDWDTMFYNNLLPIPLLAILSFIMEDWSKKNLEINFPADTRSVLLFTIALSGLGAVCISYSTAWCLRTTSGTTYSMAGALNKLPVAASGLIFFGDPATLGSVSAILTGFFAGTVYAVAKNNQAKAEKARNGDGMIPMSNRRA